MLIQIMGGQVFCCSLTAAGLGQKECRQAEFRIFGFWGKSGHDLLDKIRTGNDWSSGFECKDLPLPLIHIFMLCGTTVELKVWRQRAYLYCTRERPHVANSTAQGQSYITVDL